jgi:hypothetical protein
VALGLPAFGYVVAHQGGNLSISRGSRGSNDAKMAMKYPLHDLLSFRKPDFKIFVRGLA